jgi:hypothetical protein
MLIGNIESRTSHGKRIVDSEGEYMGLVAHEEVVMTYIATPDIRHIKYVSVGDLLFGNITV